MKHPQSLFTPRGIAIFFLLLIGVTFSTWLLEKNKQSTNSLSKGSEYKPDAYAQDIVATQINALGEKHSEMHSPKIIHYPFQNSADIVKPYIIIYSDKGQAPWYISSNKGKTEHGTDTITLQENVVLHQPPSPKNQDLTINTSSLTILPKQHLATTDQPIELNQPGITITSVGMNAYINDKRVELLSHAQGTYDPKKADKSLLSSHSTTTPKPSTSQ